MNASLLLVLAGGFVCLLGFGATGLWLAAEQKRQAQWAARRAAVTAPFAAPKRSEAPSMVALLRQQSRPSRVSPLAALLNWRHARRAQYPIGWPGALAVMLGPALLAGLLGTRVAGPAGWLLVPLADILLTRVFLGWCIGRVSRRLLAQFPDALSMVARSVRVGVPVTEAIRVVAREAQPPTQEEFARAADQMQIGVGIESALNEMAEKNDLPEYRFFATALALQAQTGGGLTETLDTLADTIRKRETARKRGYALASEARTSIYVLVALPIVVTAALFVINPDYILVLFTDPHGEKLLGIGCGMLTLGLVAMQQVIARSLR